MQVMGHHQRGGAGKAIGHRVAPEGVPGAGKYYVNHGIVTLNGSYWAVM